MYCWHSVYMYIGRNVASCTRLPLILEYMYLHTHIVIAQYMISKYIQCVRYTALW